MSSDQQYPYQGAHGGGHRNGPQGGPDQDVSQTWEGQTWDTHYQPAVPSAPDGGVYLPPQQTGPAPAAYDAPTDCLPPVADPAPPAPAYPAEPQAAHPGYGSRVYAPEPPRPRRTADTRRPRTRRTRRPRGPRRPPRVRPVPGGSRAGRVRLGSVRTGGGACR
ncbi:hypothetical protein [Streptomyces sp. CC228A]|uniref:hypothetical protein n=1 Tax=Streptomyces sp. CC228A TaxID=2898186 RepID=UPI0035A93B86